MRDIKAYSSSYDQASRGLRIHLLEDITTKVTAQSVISDIDFWEASNIEFEVYSFGGSLFDALAIYDYLGAKNISSTFSIYGMAGSAMTVLACAGKEVRIGPHSFYFIHRSTVNGKRTKETRMADDRMVNIYAKKTGLDKGYIRELMRKETTLTAEEAVRLGFVDELLPEMAIAASYNDFLSTNNMSDNQEANTPNIEENKTLLAKVATALGLKEAEDTSKEVEHEDKEADEILASMSEDLKAKTTALDEMGGELENVKAELTKKEAEFSELKAEKESASEEYAAKIEAVETECNDLKAKVEEQEAIIAKLKNDPIPSGIKAEATEVQDPGATSKPKKAARKIMTDKQEAFIEAQKARRERNK